MKYIVGYSLLSVLGWFYGISVAGKVYQSRVVLLWVRSQGLSNIAIKYPLKQKAAIRLPRLTST